MLGGRLIRQRTDAQNADFVEKLEHNLSTLPPEFQSKLKKLNFFSNAYDFCEDAIQKINLKLATLELLDEFIQNGYHPIFVGIDFGYYVYSNQLALQHLPVFKEMLNLNEKQSTPQPVLPVFSGLSAKAKPFIPKPAIPTPAQANRTDLSMSA